METNAGTFCTVLLAKRAPIVRHIVMTNKRLNSTMFRVMPQSPHLDQFCVLLG